jgi:membrane protein
LHKVRWVQASQPVVNSLPRDVGRSSLNYIERIRNLYKKVDALTGGRLSIFSDAIDSFNRMRGSQAAAALAYYAFFSLFPLLLVLVSVGSLLLVNNPLQHILDFITPVLPLPRSLIETNIQRVLQMRGTVGLIGLITLIWSASGGLAALVNNINLAWPKDERRGIIQQRLIAFAIILALFVLLIVSIIGPPIVDIFNQILTPIGLGGLINNPMTLSLLTNAISWLLSFLAYLGLYRWLPHTRVRWVSAFWGAVFSATALKIAISVLTWYLSSGLNRYQLVYGSLGTVIALLIMIYITSVITLFGAHFTSAIQSYLEKQEKTVAD